MISVTASFTAAASRPTPKECSGCCAFEVSLISRNLPDRVDNLFACCVAREHHIELMEIGLLQAFV